MSITTSSGERFDSLENFIGDSPNEYVKMEFGALYGDPISLTKPKQPVGPVDAPTSKGDWESEVITNYPPKGYMEPKDTMKEYKQDIESKRDTQRILEIMGLPPVEERGKVITPGQLDWTKTKDLGKEVKYD